MSITDKFNYLKQTKENLKEVINLVKDEDEDKLTEESTFRSYPEALRKNYIKALNEGSDFIYDSLDKVTEEGETVVLDNTAVAPMKVSLNGNISQEKINAEAGTEIVDTEISVSDANSEKENYITLQGNTYQETIEAQAGSEVEDTELVVNDVDSSKENYITLKGNTSQDTTSGKNLFDTDVERKNAFSTGSVGQVVGYGNSSASYSYVNCAKLEANKTYTLSWVTEGTKGATTNRNSKIVDDNNIVLEEFATWINNVSKITFTPSNDGYLVLTTDISSANIQLELGSTATSWEKYTGGQPSPSPDFPQQVKVVKGENVVSVSGKNLFNKSIAKTYKWISATGNFVNSTDPNVVSDYIPVKEGSSYIVSGIGNLQLRVCTYSNKNGNWVSTPINNVRTTRQFIADAPFVRLAIGGGDAVSIIDDIQLEQGSTATPYVPYSKTDYEVNLGKNLFDYQNQSYNAVRASYVLENNGLKITSSGSYAMITTDFDVEIGKTYTISFDTINSDNMAAGIQIRSSTALIISEGGDTGNHSLTFTPTENKVHFRFYSNTSGTETTNEVQYQNIQIEEGSVATSYSPYFTPIELCKIGDYQDYLFKNNGKWYIHREVGKYKLDENTSFAQNWNTNTDYETYCIICGLNTNLGGNAIAISNILPYVSFIYAYDKIGIYQEEHDNGRIIFRVPKTIASNISEFKTWLASNNMIVYTPIMPVEEEITNIALIEQLNNLYTAQLNNEVNYINTETENLFPYINLKYNVVTQIPSPDRASEIETVKGNNVISVQGKNLLGLINGTYSHNGITAVVNDGTITITGTATANSFVNIPLIKDIVLSNEQVTASINNATTISDTATEFRVYESGSNYIPVQFTTINRKTTTTKTGTYVSAYVRTASGVNYGNGLVIKPQLEYGSTATSYVLYSKTDYPINLNGKNLFNMNNATYVKKYGSSYSVDGQEITVTPATTWGNVTYSYKVKNNTTYTLKMKITFEGTTQTRWWLSLGNEENDAVYNGGYIDLEDGYLIKTFTTTSKILTISFQGSTTIQPTSTLFSEIQLELGSTATDYEPYITPIELCKINTYKDYLFKKDDKWYIHKEIEKQIYNGSENWSLSSLGDAKFYLLLDKSFKLKDTAIGIAPISSHFIGRDDSQFFENGIAKLYYPQAESRYFLRVENDETPTLEDFKSWLSNNNVTLYYVLAEPVETEITSLTLIEQLDNLYTAQLNNEINYITTETGNLLPYIDLKYNVVTQMPSPERPSEVKVVKGENVVSVSGKNLLNVAGLSNNSQGVVSTGTSDGKVACVGTASTNYFNVKPKSRFSLSAGTYIFSIQTAIANRLRIRLWDSSDNIIGTYNINAGNTSVQFTINENAEFLMMFIDSGVATGALINITMYPMIRLSSEIKTDFVPYSKTDYPINLGDIELCKINTYKDYFHKDSGKWYVHKEINKVVLNGSETGWSYYPTGQYFYKTWNYPRGSAKVFIQFISNRYKNYQQQIFPSDNNKMVLVQQPDRNSEINISNHDYTTTSDFKTWLSTHNTIVYYPLATPTEEEITNTTLIEQLEAISNAKSVKDKTYITQTNEEIPFIIDATAIKKYEEVQ